MKLTFLIILLFCLPVFAVVDGYKYSFSDSEQEKRFQELSEQLRCPKCQNQNLADSNSPVAEDLRDKVYELINKGQNNDEIVTYMVERYGDFVRYNPPLNIKTVFLWGLPVLFLLIGAALLIALKPKTSSQTPTLSDEEQAKLKKLKQQAGVDTK